MVVRDEQGNILNPLHTPTIQLYKHHEIATERIQNSHVKFVFIECNTVDFKFYNIYICRLLGCIKRLFSKSIICITTLSIYLYTISRAK